MTANEAAHELAKAVQQAIERYEQEAPGGMCVGFYVDRFNGEVKVRPRLQVKSQAARASR